MRDRDSEKKQLAKGYADRRNHMKDTFVGKGDGVLLERRKENELYASYESEPYSYPLSLGPGPYAVLSWSRS